MITISIIVPIYNVEKYLRKCLDTLVNQTLQDIEIILVNDASPDQSDLIMKEYEDRYENVTCIYLTENLCQGGARNKGIEIAKGQYIMFVDSDDWIDLTMCEKLYQKAVECDSDIVGCDYYKHYGDKKKDVYSNLYYEEQVGVLDDAKRASLFFVYAIPWAKIIKKEIIVDNNLYFPTHMKFEDYAVIPLLFLSSKKMNTVREGLYYYNILDGSTSRNITENNISDVIRSGEMIRDNFIVRGMWDRFSEEIRGLYIKQIFNAINKVINSNGKDKLPLLMKIRPYLSDVYPEYKNNHYYYTITRQIARKAAALLIENTEELESKVTKEVLNQEINYIEDYVWSKERISEILKYCQSMNYKIAIWGGGQKGNDFLRVMDSERTIISYVIDGNEEKHGTTMETGHSIIGIEEAANKVDMIIVMNKIHYKKNRKTIIKQNEKIITLNLEIYLLMKHANITDFIA